MDSISEDDDGRHPREREDGDPFEFPAHRSVERLREWRKATFTVNAARRYRYALDLRLFETKPSPTQDDLPCIEHGCTVVASKSRCCAPLNKLQRKKIDPALSRLRAGQSIIRTVDRFAKLGLDRDLYTDLRAGVRFIQVPPTLMRGDSCTREETALLKKIDQLFASCPPSSRFGARVIGLYGKTGIGKTTLCKSLCDYYHAENREKVSILELIEPSPHEQTCKKKRLKSMRHVLRTLTGAKNGLLSRFSADGQAINSLKERISKCDVNLVIDNVAHNWELKEEARSYLKLGFTSGSQVLVTSENQETLLDLGITESCCFGMFSLSIMDECLPDSVADRIIASKRPRQNIFLSASDSQEDFAEKLCADLRKAEKLPFFKKRLHSGLYNGEVIAKLIFTATQECELVVVVLSEEYFTGSIGHMLALSMFVKSIRYTSWNMKILPLYHGLTRDEFKSSKRREEWFRVWEEWSKVDNRVSLDEWKHVLLDLDRRRYMEVPGKISAYKKFQIVPAIFDMLQQQRSQAEAVSSLADQMIPHNPPPPCRFYKNQCRVLEEQLLAAEEVLNRKPSPNDDLLWPQSALTELRRVVTIGKRLIESCEDEPALKAYLRQAERTDAFVETLKGIVWCMSTVFYYNTIKRYLQWTEFPHELGPIPYSMARVGEAERHLLGSAVLADRKELEAALSDWIPSHFCSVEECGTIHEAVDSRMCLAAQILARESKGYHGDRIIADHTSVLWKTTQEALVGSRQIGKGSFGTVFETKWLNDTYAKKEFQMIPADFVNEANALARLNHPHVVKVSAYSVGAHTCFFLMEKMDCDLRTYMTERMSHHGISPPFSVLASIDLMLQISDAMSYVNSQGMVHRDLKAANILINAVEDPELRKEGFVIAKLADFGLAKCKHEITSYLTRDNQGTTYWRAPEMFQAGAVAVDATYLPRQADVYSFGIVCSEILTGKFPFQGRDQDSCPKPSEIYKLITDAGNPRRPELPEQCPESLKSLIRRCWVTDPRRRPTFLEISTSLRDLKGPLMMVLRTQP